MNKIIYKAENRGRADYGWLKANYYFSFANYYDSERIHFGMLRVLNDDFIAAGMGFDPHPHNDMEIITIPLSGVVAHRDSTGGEGKITAGEVQVMSAGNGVIHSEYNGSKTEDLKLFQIWVFPKEKGITPRYDQKKFDTEERKNKWQLLVSNDGRNDSLQINQDAFFSMGEYESGQKIVYSNYKKENGIFILVVEGEVNVANEKLTTRDAIGITEENEITLEINEAAKILIIEVPLL